MEKENLIKVRHFASHLLAVAILEIYPETKMAIGSTIDNGFYYDFDFTTPINDKDLSRIEQKMRELLKKWSVFEKKEVSIDEARKLFAHQSYKLELISELEKDGVKPTVYTFGNFVDLCPESHINIDKEIEMRGIKLDRISGAYWKGDEKNKMLTRIYGLAFENKEKLEEHIKLIEEAKKRDHRKLGRELDLFHIDEKVGSGLPLWHPKGAMLWRVIEDFWYKEHINNGYDLVRSPHIGNRILWEISGHWGFYNSSMYPPIDVGQTLEEKQKGEQVKSSEEYLLKPMNCPFHIQIYKNEPKSYRQLPFRWAECGTVYRFEKKGELSGLTRVRGFTQDDAHIICREDQVEDELKKVIDFIIFMYKSFGFDPKSVKVYLSLRDPKNKEKYIGDDSNWKFTEDILRKVAVEKGLDFTEEKGEAAFYGPKLDFKIKDALCRSWQCSTLQFDFNLPERFDLDFKNKEGKQERPYMLHRALFGSFERFIGLLIEHYARNFPFWLSPVQVKIIPVRKDHNDYAKKIFDELKSIGIRIDFDDSDEGMGRKIHNGKVNKIPYMLVIGDKEIENGELTLETRDGNKQEKISLGNLKIKLASEVENKK